MAISFEEVRRRILIALFSDDELMDALVLKGGNALALVYQVGSRASLDLDFSIKSAFEDLDRAGARICAALRNEFQRIGYVVFDEKFEIKPSQAWTGKPDWWGGYLVEFKLAEQAIYDKFAGDIEALRRNSEVLGPQQKRKYTIDISHHEFCEGKVQREFDDYIIYVYSLEMIAAEKLRAICQQMPEYEFNRTKAPRARDFYDIHQIVVERKVDPFSSGNLALIAAVFDAKRVPLRLLERIGDTREFHVLDWPSVESSIAGQHESFDYYFDYIVALARKLYALGIVDSPSA
jgi:predicted nucleotidyltransferase component of viral defense system